MARTQASSPELQTLCLVPGPKEGNSFNHLNIFSSDVLCVGDLLLGLNGVDCSTLTQHQIVQVKHRHISASNDFTI